MPWIGRLLPNQHPQADRDHQKGMEVPSLGIGLHDLTTEITTATLNSFLLFYGYPTGIGIMLWVALKNMQIEIGVQDCSLDYDYKVWGH